MSLTESIISSIAKKIVDEISEKFESSIFVSKIQANRNLELRFRQISNWSSKIELYDLGKGLETLKYTLSLSLTDSPKRLAKIGKKSSVSSDALIYLESNILLLGDPGSGKTTTLKRICQQMLSELERKENDLIIPILFRLRNINLNNSLFIILAEYLGIHYHTIENQQGFFINGKPIDYVMIRILDSISSCIFFDGLDEIDSSKQKELMNQISELSSKLKISKILITSRSGAYNSLLEGFSVYEIEPLTSNQIEMVSSAWLPDSRDFLDKLKELPYKDTLNRPLALVNVLIIYANKGYLPSQPSAVYKILIDLFIEKWDRQNGVDRKSKYADFLPQQKVDFLAELSFYLLYKMGQPLISFTSNQLAEVYKLVHSRYQLPENESKEVVQEIESYSGLLVENFGSEYQFSHLTYQEYLSAIYIVRNPVIDETITYLMNRPAPVAVAVSISSNPNNWLDSMFLGQNIGERIKLNSAQLAEFLKRLNIEKPYLNGSGITGYAFLNIAFIFYDKREIVECLQLLLNNPVIKLIMNKSLLTYEVLDDTIESRFFKFSLNRSSKISNNFHAPKSGLLLKVFAEQILS